jgi:hypothetical protein
MPHLICWSTCLPTFHVGLNLAPVSCLCATNNLGCMSHGLIHMGFDISRNFWNLIWTKLKWPNTNSFAHVLAISTKMGRWEKIWEPKICTTFVAYHGMWGGPVCYSDICVREREWDIGWVLQIGDGSGDLTHYGGGSVVLGWALARRWQKSAVWRARWRHRTFGSRRN